MKRPRRSSTYVFLQYAAIANEALLTHLQLLLENKGTEVWALWDLPPLESYTKPGSNVVLLGDAAHATTPFQGQGAGQAIEDAYVVQSLLGKVESKDEIPMAFKAYDTIRRPRSLKVTSTSQDALELTTLNAPGIYDDAAKLKDILEWRMDWIWNRDIELEAVDAGQVFEHLLDPQTGR